MTPRQVEKKAQQAMKLIEEITEASLEHGHVVPISAPRSVLTEAVEKAWAAAGGRPEDKKPKEKPADTE